MPSFEGIWVPIVTPFRNGFVDVESAQQLAVDLVGAGIDGIVVCGTTGEASALDNNEQETVLYAVHEAVGSLCPIVMGVNGNCTRNVADKVRNFTQDATAGFLISAPSYVRPSQQGILLHFQAIAAATDRPIILYNIPARTGVTIEAATIEKISFDPQFIAIKQCGGNIAELINNTTLKVLCGDDDSLFTVLCLGGHGAISAAAHIRPDLYVYLFDLIRTRQIEQARELFNQLLPLITLLFSEPNPGPIKSALAMQGRIKEELRLPMTPMSTNGKEKLAIILEQVLAIPRRSSIY